MIAAGSNVWEAVVVFIIESGTFVCISAQTQATTKSETTVDTIAHCMTGSGTRIGTVPQND